MSNPYQSYPPLPQPSRSGPAPSHVVAPAVALIAVGIIDGIQAIYGLSRNLLGLNEDSPPPRNLQDRPDLMEIYNALEPYRGAINIIGTLLAVLCAAAIILAGVQMLRRKMYPLCMTGSILAAVPCLSFLACCLVGEAVGLWAAIVLLRTDVRQSFD